MITRSRKLSLKLVYQLTHRMIISRSKCRPLNKSSIGTNRRISSSSPGTDAFAPEPYHVRYAFGTDESPRGATLRYGYGKDPYCNLTDESDMAVPVFSMAIP